MTDIAERVVKIITLEDFYEVNCFNKGRTEPKYESPCISLSARPKEYNHLRSLMLDGYEEMNEFFKHNEMGFESEIELGPFYSACMRFNWKEGFSPESFEKQREGTWIKFLDVYKRNRDGIMVCSLIDKLGKSGFRAVVIDIVKDMPTPPYDVPNK